MYNKMFHIAMLLLFSMCDLVNPCSKEELHRVVAQDGKVEAVVVIHDCGATTSISYKVFIVPKGQNTIKSHPVFVADHVIDLEVKWTEPKVLSIVYKEARIFNFTNFWHSKDVENFDYLVNIREENIQ